jgi:hypothetical protein
MRGLAITAGVVIGFGVGFIVSAVAGIPDQVMLLATVGAGLFGVVVARLVPRSDRSRRRAQERDERVNRFGRSHNGE